MARKKSDVIVFDPTKFEPCGHLQGMYQHFNKKWFDYQLPYVRCGYYRFSKKEEKKDGKEYGSTIRFFGAKFPTYILINPFFREWTKTVESTLLHEMVHVKLYAKYGQAHGHGPVFQKELKKLLRKGAFDDTIL